jgi:hypothetical protein
MSNWWVCKEESGPRGRRRTWHGPFGDQEEAVQKARGLSDPPDGDEVLAVVIRGEAGGTGRRVVEYYYGEEYRPGTSGWHDDPPEAEVPIPVVSGD